MLLYVFSQFQPCGFGQGKKHLYDVGIKLRATTALDFVACMIDAKAFAIGPIG